MKNIEIFSADTSRFSAMAESVVVASVKIASSESHS
jgi:hypothetical protein